MDRLENTFENFNSNSKDLNSKLEELLSDFDYTKNIQDISTLMMFPHQYLTKEQALESKELFKQTFESEIEKLNLGKEEVQRISNDVYNYINNATKKIYQELDDKTPSFDFIAIGESAGSSAAIGGAIGAASGSAFGGIGAIPAGIVGTLVGAISGATGEIAKQVALHNGASNLLANGIKFGIEVGTGAGIGKMVLNSVGKISSNAILLAPEIKSTDLIVKQYDDIVRYSSDKIKTIDFDAKGIINSLKTHDFIDGLGNPLVAKIDDVIDLTRTIKMPYLGSEKGMVNTAGFERNSQKFAKQYAELFPETFSKFNMDRALQGKAPIVDSQWIRFNPNHKTFLGQKLHHHHINNTDMAVYVPEGLHNGRINHEILHVDNNILTKEIADLFKQRMGRI